MKLLIQLGNGFSLDFIKYVGYDSKIDLQNLFTHGTNVMWPADQSLGFLSFKNCPYLWNLGARQNIDNKKSSDIIEDIITCANVFAYGKASVGRTPNKNDKSLFVFAYKELIEYLRYLFIYYNNLISETNFKRLNINNWSWAKYFKKVYRDSRYSCIDIVTYNYDIWLERVLKYLKIPFRIMPFESSKPKTKINIYKPHGSISFCHRLKNDLSSYSIKHDYDLVNGDVDEFNIQYNDLEENYLLTALIPPAGESRRYNQSWSNKIRKDVVSIAESLTLDDFVIICGISYWYVDRFEIDEILTKIDENVNVSIINPYLGNTFNAVLTSLFKNYTLHKFI